jgi:pimeloyl-ACP methyl ester carboxylesterase
MNNDDDENPLWFRELRIDAWNLLIGDSRGILSVREKLEAMYSTGAPKIKVDQANSEFSEGNWHYEFAQLAQQALEEKNYLAATGYYTLAAYPQAYQDERAVEMYTLAWDTFKKALVHGSYPHKTITVKVDGVDITAYLVYPQSYRKGDSVPVVIETGGTDSLATFNFTNYLLHWNKANMAWIGFDIPGLGTSIDLKLTYEAEKVHLAFIKALQADNAIDQKNIFIIGRSAGGYAALRLIATQKADHLDLAGIVAFCPIAEHLFSQIDEDFMQNIDPAVLNTWAARTKTDPGNVKKLVDEGKQFRFSHHGLWGNTFSSVPLLVYNQKGDFLNPVSEMKKIATLSKNGKYIVAEPEYADDDNHCGCRKQALKIFAKFVDENMR